MMPGARHLLARCRSWLEAVARALGQLLSLLERPLPVEASRPPRVLLVTAHPDDECMFFTPTLSSLAAAGAELWLLCLSTGDAEGKGAIRREELLRSCRILQISDSRVIIVDDPLLQDGMRTQWPAALIADIVAERVRDKHISMILTFDSGGVSGHPNHRAVHCGVMLYLRGSTPTDDEHRRGSSMAVSGGGLSHRRAEIPAGTPGTGCPVAAYELVTMGTLRTFVGPLGTLVSAAAARLGLSDACCVARDARLSAKAMAAHTSQLLWYRRLYVLFSRYSYVNTLKRMHPSA